MNDSNRTLRFARSLRETPWACDLPDYERDWQDKLVAWVVTMAIVFVVGMVVGIRIGGV